jgi:hypothetical protein
VALPSYDLVPRICSDCGAEFQPQRGGYNARYCSQLCKDRVRRRRAPSDVKTKARRRSWLHTKSDKDRLKRHQERGNNSRRKVRKWLADYKMSRGCIDCGYRGHFAALQLDHEGEKSAEIANCRSSVARLQEEIEKGKCVVRCAVCHSVKTWAEKNGVPYVPTMARAQQ